MKPKRADILRRHYGINGKMESMARIGRDYHDTKQNIQQTKKVALRHMYKVIIRKRKKHLENLIVSIQTFLKEQGVARESFMIDFVKKKSAQKTNENFIQFMLAICPNVQKQNYYNCRDCYPIMWLNNGGINISVVKNICTVVPKIAAKHFGLYISENYLIEGVQKQVVMENADFIRKSLYVCKKLRKFENYWILKQRKRLSLYIQEIFKDGKPRHFRQVASEIALRFNAFYEIGSVYYCIFEDPKIRLMGSGVYVCDGKRNKTNHTPTIIKNILKKEKALGPYEILLRAKKIKPLLRYSAVYACLYQNPQFEGKNGKYVLVE